MSFLPVLSEPHPILRQKALLVANMNSTLRVFIENMFSIMEKEKGIGLAANQIGVLKRIIVIDIAHKNLKNIKKIVSSKIVLINPEIVWHSNSEISSQEGCLSVPNIYEKIDRFKKILVIYQDVMGNFKKIQAEGLLSFCIQHELDHINGILFIDHLSLLKKSFIRNKFFKYKI